MLKIPAKIEYVLEKLKENGYEAYIVGGCVRDSLLGLTPNDFDITTNAIPEDIIRIFDRTIPTGIKHGTVTVIIEKEPVEVTTFRTESGYTDSRRPDSVEFVTDLESDLSRRDFTVNALAYNHSAGLKDYFGGIEDLNDKILRAVGDPYKRFSEDALRILRLFRFASQLGFKIEETTYEAALDLSFNLENISSERIFTEILKGIKGEYSHNFSPIFENGCLKFLGITKTMDFRILKNLKHNETLCLCATVYNTSQRPLDTLKKLKCSNAQYRACENFLKLVKLPLPREKADLKNALFLTDEISVSNWLSYLKFSLDTTKAEEMLAEIYANNEPYLISHLAINGRELQKMGFSGKSVGETLEKLRQEVIKNPMLNTKEQLRELGKKI